MTHCVPGPLPGAEVSLPPDLVADPFYAYLVGLVRSGRCGVLDPAGIAAVLGARSLETRVPWLAISSIERRGGPTPDSAAVSIGFTQPIALPVPYDLLGYHPGQVRAAQRVDFVEWQLPLWQYRVDGRVVRLTDVYLFGLVGGWAQIDIDHWLDVLLGPVLDDGYIVALALFRHEGRWYAAAAGLNPDGGGVSGVLDLADNRILFPSPRELKPVGPFVRWFALKVKQLPLRLPPPVR